MRSGVKYCELSSVCTSITDGSHFSPKEDPEGLIPMLSVKDMTADGFDYSSCKCICESDYRVLVSNGCRPSVGDVLVAKDGSYLKTAFVQKEDKEQALLSSIAILTPKTDIILPEYLAFFFKAPHTKATVERHYLTGTAIKRVILKGFKVIKAPVPPLSEQKRIVAELDLLQSIIDKQKAQLKELDTLAQATFYDMFGDPVQNEKGLEINRLGDVLRTTSGGTPSKEHPEYYEKGTIPWVNSGDLHQMYIYDVPKHITQLGVDNSSAKLFPVDTVLVAMYGATVGETSILKIESTTNQAVCGLFPSKHYLPTFLYCVLKYSQSFFIDRASGGAQPNISQGIIKDFNLITPSIKEQKAFAAKIEAIEQQKALINQSIAETQKLFDYTMDKYFG